MTHFLCRLCALLVAFAIGLCALNYAAQRLALWAIVLLTLAAGGCHVYVYPPESPPLRWQPPAVQHVGWEVGR